MEARKKRSIPGKLLLCLLFSGVLVMCLEMGLSMLRPEAPGSPARHAALWAACVGLLATGTLLVVFWQPAAKAWQWAEDRIMNPETRKPWIDIALAVAAGAMLLHHFYVILYYPVIPAGATKLTPVWIVLAAVTAVLGRSWRDRGTRIGTLLLVYMFERLYLKNMAVTGNETVWFASGIYAVFICYGIAGALRPSSVKTLLMILCALWSLASIVISAVGIYAAWTGSTVFNPAGAAAQVTAWRLYLFANPVISGGLMSCCVVMAFMGILLFKQTGIKICFFMAALAAALTTSLTDSRSALVMIAFLLTGALFLAFQNKAAAFLRKASKARKIITVILLGVCLAACFFVLLRAERMLTHAFVDIRDRGGIPIAAACADEITESPEVTEAPTLPPLGLVYRDVLLMPNLSMKNILTGRLDIWQKTAEYLKENPGSVLLGLSVDGSVPLALEREDHVHNILMQLLLEGGIPALLLYLGLLLYFFIHACRLWKRRQLPLWQRVLPVPVLAILLQEMAECLTHFAYGHPPMTVLWFFMGCTVAVSRQALAEEAGKTAGASLTRGTTGG